MTTLLTLLVATLLPAAVLSGVGTWMVRKEPGDVTRAVGFAFIIGGVLLAMVAGSLPFVVTTSTASMP